MQETMVEQVSKIGGSVTFQGDSSSTFIEKVSLTHHCNLKQQEMCIMPLQYHVN